MSPGCHCSVPASSGSPPGGVIRWARPPQSTQVMTGSGRTMIRSAVVDGAGALGEDAKQLATELFVPVERLLAFDEGGHDDPPQQVVGERVAEALGVLVGQVLVFRHRLH